MKTSRNAWTMVMLGCCAGMLTLQNEAAAQTSRYVDDDTCPSVGTGTVGDPYRSVQSAIVAALSSARDGGATPIADAWTYDPRAVLFVDADATGSVHDGSTWCEAFLDLQDALAVAFAGSTIKVANGTYKPTTGEDRTATFLLVNGVTIEGGYAGCGAADPDERDIELNETILTGVLVPEDDIPPGPGGGTPGETCELAGAINYGETDFDTTGASTDGPGDCSATQDIWYIHTPALTGNLVVSLCGSSYDTVLAVYDGNACPPATLLGCNDDFCDVQSKLTVPVVEGNDYLILVGGYSGETGAGVISFSYDTGVNSYHVVTGNSVDATAVLDGFTITGGKANSEEEPDFIGGGMFNASASPTVANCRFRQNRANGHGAGMVNYYMSAPTVTNCTFSENSSESVGGGMAGIFYSSAMVTDCAFTGNTATAGGGMYNDSFSPAMVINSAFTGNSATSYGGGMVNVGSDSIVANCTFSGNSANDNGGGMFNYGSGPTVTNCTFSGNSASDGGGMNNIESSFPTVTNCIFWSNTGGELANDGTSAPFVRYTDVQDDDPDDGSEYPGVGNIDDDPLFVDADGPDAVVGTEDDDLRLSTGSPCIDTGDNTAVIVPTDLDGNIRVVDGDGDATPIVDMGAYEFGSIPDDCNENGIPDMCDLDCNALDGACDVPDCGQSSDSDGSGTPDECDCYPSTAPAPELLDLPLNPVSQKIRYLSFIAGDTGKSQAVRVTFGSVPSPYDHWNGTELWVQQPQAYCENAGVAQADPCPEGAGGLPSPVFWGAGLGCDPHWTDWTAYDVVHVFNEGIIPGGEYDIQVIDSTCSLDVDDDYSDALTMTQSAWADLIQDCTTTPCKPPDGSTGIVDVTAILDKWKNLPGNVKKVRADIEGSPGGDHRLPDQAINITDVTYCLGAFLGDTYPGPGFPLPSDPPDCP